jgi:hypothetical protein
MTREQAVKLVETFEGYVGTLSEGYGQPFDEAVEKIDALREQLVTSLTTNEEEE